MQPLIWMLALIARAHILIVSWLVVLIGQRSFAAGSATNADTRPDLPACAQMFGTLSVDYWLTKDLERQIERLLFYRDEPRNSNRRQQFKAFQQSLQSDENGLHAARMLYKTVFATNSIDGLARLASMLSKLAVEKSRNAAAAEKLLQGFGDEISRGKFLAVPVKRSELAPGWDNGRSIGKAYRPKRILFGSTGRPGDDRILPLGFDFGSGLYGAFVPMLDPTNLAIGPGLANRKDPAYSWMQSNHFGHHYWAGVYNNQNTYVAPWFLKAHGEEDIWMKLADGKVLKSTSDWGQLNIWNPSVDQYIQNYCETQARAFKDDPFLVCYDYTAEPHPWASQPDGQAQYSGYNNSAVEAFRNYLRKKFGSIEKLNREWRSNYGSWNVIEAPPDKYLHPPARATALSYEFERFRCDSHAAIWKRAYNGYRKYDQTKPIIANAGMFMSGWPVEGLDAWQLQQCGVADWIDMHMNNFPPNLPEQIYLYSLCRLSGKVPVQFEYVWTFPRTGPLDEASESDFAAICQSSVWRNLVWGKKVLVFFDFYYDWPAYHNALFDHEAGYSILRPSACVVPLTKKKALRFNDILMHTEVTRPPIIILEPTASILNSPPLHPNKSFSYHTTVAGKEIHELLFPKNYPFLYVPEQSVVDGYDLKQHKVIILPEAPYLPARVTERLLSWIKQGGTLISLGPPGIWNPHGQDDMRILDTMFRGNEITDENPGQWKWKWNIAGSRDKQMEQIKTADGKLVAASASFGKGRVLVSTGAYDDGPLRKLFYGVLDDAIGKRPSACAKDSFELVLREDDHGQRYLFVLNPHTCEVREDEITIVGRFPECVDLGIGSGVPIPVSTGDSNTTFRLRLHPGEGTVISLRLR